MWARFNQAQSQFTVDSGRAGDQHGTEGVGQNAPTKLFDSFVSPLQFVLLNTYTEEALPPVYRTFMFYPGRVVLGLVKVCKQRRSAALYLCCR